MEDYLTIIRRIIEWHQTLREHVRLVGDSLSDREALTSLERARADWVPGRPEILAEKQKKLQRAISSLDEGLKNHFAYEEKYLPPILGELFMQALILDHREIMKAINEVESTVSDMRLEGLSREELLAEDSHMQGVIDNVYQLNEDHLAREEVILDMVRRALEEKAKHKN